MAAARAEAEEAVAPEEGHGHSAKEVEFLGHLEDNRVWWDQLARDKFVSEAVRGHRLEFDSRPPMSLPTRPPPQRMGKEKRLALQQEVLSLLRKRAIEPVRDRQAGFYSKLF